MGNNPLQYEIEFPSSELSCWRIFTCVGGLVRELFRKLVAPVQITVWPQNTSPVHCRDQPNTTENLQCLDARIPTPSRESPAPVDTAARLRNISSGFCRGDRDYSEMTPSPGALIPALS